MTILHAYAAAVAAARRAARGGAPAPAPAPAPSPVAPTFTAAPVILGTPTVGTPVAFTTGTATGTPTPTVGSPQWLLDDAPISGATSSTYTPVTGDIGTSRLSVRQTATNGVGSPANSTSSAVSVAAAGAKNAVAKTWSITASSDGDKWSAWPAGDKPFGSVYDAAAQDAAFNALYTTARGSTAGAKWVATIGNDTTGNGTSGNPYLTIGKAIDNITSGGCVMVKAGIYTGYDNWISHKQRTIPGGSAGNFTRIFAEVPFTVRITFSVKPVNDSDGPVHINTNYVWVDGIIVESTYTANAGYDSCDSLFAIDGLHNRLTRCIAKNKSTSQYSALFWLGGIENYNVVEDCMGFGSYRYMFSAGAGGASSPAGKLVLRRCIGYGPFGLCYEPTALFSFYGSNEPTYLGCKDVLYANCYAIDSPHLPKPAGQSPEDLKWGDWYHPKSVRYVRHVGCGSVNGGSEYGTYCQDNLSGDTTQTLGTFDDCFGVGSNGGSNAVIRKAVGYGTTPINHVTAIGAPGGAFPPSETTGANNLTSGAVYPVQRVGGNGAEQKYCVGAFLTEYDQTGYDVLQTSMKLWPLPYESIYKSLWAETITKATQDTGLSASANPCAGTAIGGGAMTFTHRVWESLGTSTPSFATGAGVY